MLGKEHTHTHTQGKGGERENLASTSNPSQVGHLINQRRHNNQLPSYYPFPTVVPTNPAAPPAPAPAPAPAAALSDCCTLGHGRLRRKVVRQILTLHDHVMSLGGKSRGVGVKLERRGLLQGRQCAMAHVHFQLDFLCVG